MFWTCRDSKLNIQQQLGVTKSKPEDCQLQRSAGLCVQVLDELLLRVRCAAERRRVLATQVEAAPPTQRAPLARRLPGESAAPPASADPSREVARGDTPRETVRDAPPVTPRDAAPAAEEQFESPPPPPPPSAKAPGPEEVAGKLRAKRPRGEQAFLLVPERCILPLLVVRQM